jgi:hypothetical protein
VTQTRPAAARSRRNRRLLLLALVAPVGGWLAIETLSAPRAAGTGAGDAGGARGIEGAGLGEAAGTPGAVQAYLSATGIFALPGAGGAPEAYAAAEAAAAEAGSPLAFAVWGERPSFDTGAWRDIVQLGRLPIGRPPAVDFDREVAVLIWPAAGAPASLRRANGLVLRGALLQHLVVEVRVAPARNEPPPATPASGGEVVPYALVTVPRRGWPVPAPPPTIPPVTVSLAA